MSRGWLIGVMVELDGEPGPVRHFFAVGNEDRAAAEWKAIDGALRLGPVASSPVAGLEPVHALGELSPKTIHIHGLRPGEVRPLGRKTPRLWATLERVPSER
jgi:hypothetical protein